MLLTALLDSPLVLAALIVSLWFLNYGIGAFALRQYSRQNSVRADGPAPSDAEMSISTSMSTMSTASISNSRSGRLLYEHLQQSGFLDADRDRGLRSRTSQFTR
jgi:hypothetical protein